MAEWDGVTTTLPSRQDVLSPGRLVDAESARRFHREGKRLLPGSPGPRDVDAGKQLDFFVPILQQEFRFFSR